MKKDKRFVAGSNFLSWHNLIGARILEVDDTTACNVVKLTVEI